jgi:hypothetical protein
MIASSSGPAAIFAAALVAAVTVTYGILQKEHVLGHVGYD